MGADIVGECTNELGTKVAEGIKGILSDLHKRLPSTHLVIMALLPKVRSHSTLSWLVFACLHYATSAWNAVRHL